MDLSTYLDGLLLKTAIPPTELAYFLSEMRKTPSGPLITSKLLATKIQSSSETTALRAFNILEAALETEVEGSIEFRTEIGRYRFLNELIRILSPKYYGSQAIPAVKDRAAKFLTDAAGSKRKKWFPSEHSKIDAVYKSLVEGGIILPNAVDPDAEFQKSIFERGENAILLKKLLHSKDPTDLQAANRLIKNLVDEEAKRNERRSEIHSLIDRIETSTSLLNEMCSQTQIDREIVDELASTCQMLRNKLGNIGTETNEETVSLLHASENIEKALNYYEERKNHVSVKSVDLIEHPILHERESSQIPTSAASFADELLIGMDLGPISTEKQNGAEIHKCNRDATTTTTNLLNFDIDLGVGYSQQPSDKKLEEKTSRENALEELGLLSQQLIQQSLSGTPVTTNFVTEIRTSDKVTLNQLQRKCAPPVNVQNMQSIASEGLQTTTASHHLSLLDLDFLENPSSLITKNPEVRNLEKTEPLLEGGYSTTQNHQITNHTVPLDSDFSLDEIDDIDLDDVELSEEFEPIHIPLNSISSKSELVELNFTFGTFPRIPISVKVMVITLINRHPTDSVSDYGFQLLPPKGIQVKVFSPSLSELKSWKKKFLPPPALTQAVLVRTRPGLGNGKNPKNIKLKFILSFYLGDETALYNSEIEVPF